MRVCYRSRSVCICTLAVILWTASTIGAFAQSQPPASPVAAQQLRDELERLRKEFETIRDSYGQRLTALEAKLASMGAAPGAAAPAAPGVPAPVPALPAGPPAAPAPPTEAQVPAGATGAGGPQGALPVYGNPSAFSKIFNPDIAVIGNFLGAMGKNPVDPSPVFDMNEAEATFQAVVDPYARADFFFAFSPEGVEIEGRVSHAADVAVGPVGEGRKTEAAGW